jgi:hypothetical protein
MSQDSRTTRSTPSPSGSTGTGAAAMPRAEASRPTGMLPGQTGSIAKSPTALLAAAMAGADPTATARSLTAALPASFVAILDPIVHRTFPSTGEARREFLAWRLTGPVPNQDRSQVLEIVQRTLIGMPRAELSKLLVALRVTTVTRAETPELVDLQLQVYADKLAEWPADVVRALLTRWPETSRFWPTWHECLTFMEPLTRKRRALLEVLSETEGASCAGK